MRFVKRRIFGFAVAWALSGVIAMSASAMGILMTTIPSAAEETLGDPDLEVQDMYRLYNPNSGEHFYTASSNERDSLCASGWHYEGIGWKAPVSGEPVYRLYNPNAGDHHYTLSAKERDHLVSSGWNYEGIGWQSGGTVPVYRQYNPNAVSGAHNFTTNAGERSSLVKAGWMDEGTAWHAAEKGVSMEEKISPLLARTKTAQKTDQIILVVDHYLSFWEKADSGNWQMRLESYCGYGSRGLSYDRTAGDMTTPIGSFPILMAFGTGENPGTTMEYRQITPDSYWSAETNFWKESPEKIEGEHLIDYYQYKYALGIGFNYNPYVYGKGSAIFLHCKSYDQWSTAGCVSVPEDIMLNILRMSGDGTYILIVPDESEITNY